MKKNFVFLCLSFIACLSLSGQNKGKTIIELPLTWHDGYGPFELFGFGLGLQPEETMYNPWDSAEAKLKGIPTDWKETRIGYIETDRYQFEYQRFHAGEITLDSFEWLQKTWDWTPDTTRLSKVPMKCRIGLAAGKDADGQIWMVVDRNNNGDLSDDSPFIPIHFDDYMKDRNEALKHAFPVTYEKLQGGKITETRILLLLFCDVMDGWYIFSFPQYATTRLDGQLIGIHGGGAYLGYQRTAIAWMNDNNGEAKEKIDWRETIGMNEYLQMDTVCYKNLGVDPNRNVLLLQRMEETAGKLSSTQEWFRAIDLAGTDYKTKAEISLEGYRGKYVFLEFWSQTCGGCLREMPNIKNLYERVNKDKVEFIGVISDSSVRTIDKLIQKYGITWPQVFSDATNPINKAYGIIGSPTTFLINPDGIIIAKNLLSQELEEKLKEMNVLE